MYVRNLADAAENYTQAVRLLNANMAALRAAAAPVDPGSDGRPPAWTDEQRAAVWAAAWSWWAFATARGVYDNLVAGRPAGEPYQPPLPPA